MAEIGQMLRQAREEKGLTLADVERDTRIRHSYLAALEDDEFDSLPGEVYIRGFLRNYARFLSLDVQHIMELYASLRKTGIRAEAAAAEDRFSLRVPMDVPLETGFRPKVVWIFALTLLLLLGAGAWWSFHTGTAYQWLQMLPFGVYEPQVAPSQSPSAPTGQQITEEATATPWVTIEPTMAVQTITPEPAQLPQVTTTPTPNASPTATSTLMPPPVSSIEIKVEITARSWIRVMVDGEEEFSGVLQVGEERTWVGQERVALRVGNAGGVSVTLNGMPTGPLGELGEVLDVEWVQPAPLDMHNPSGTGPVADMPTVQTPPDSISG